MRYRSNPVKGDGLGVLRMNSHSARYLSDRDRASIEAAIPAGVYMTVMYGVSPGDFSVRIFEDGSNALLIISRHHATIRHGAFAALAKLAESGVSR